MLARSGTLPTRGDWSYEVKWDGFRAVVSTQSASTKSRDLDRLVQHRARRHLGAADILQSLSYEANDSFVAVHDRYALVRSPAFGH
jgi:hypothetical protein